MEAAGLATVGISLVRQQAETGRAPRMLHCQFPLGRPLGRPGDPAFQHDVLRRAFALLPLTDVPVLAEHPVVIDEQGDEPVACPLPPRHDPHLAPAVDEARGLRAAHGRHLAATRRSGMGRVAGPEGIEELLARFVRLAAGEPMAEVGWDTTTLLGASQDVRAFYEEAGAQLVDPPGARQLEAWFVRSTAAGSLLREVRARLREAGAPQPAWYYLLPATEAD
jgi:D-proline reductase (dithiol) PrdB